MTSPAHGIDVREWLASREPKPPAALAGKLAEIAGTTTCATLPELSAILVGFATDLLTELGDDRNAAGDLLAADALITYALEGAAEDCASMDAVAGTAMTAMAGLANRSNAAE